ncbi:Subunit of the glycosylphosphatidylinositol transamidase complex-like protein [Elasticomyces elasticus]|nr:Subunit of the glycosylphosphatidylinositol transamidase complex-like protein [Elasticomyces elasticus]
MERGIYLNLQLTTPAHVTVRLRGFDVAPAVTSVLPTIGNMSAAIRGVEEEGGQGSGGSYVSTTSLLLPLPIPDFSMLYNVSILMSTVIELDLGVPTSKLELRVRAVTGVLMGVVGKVKGAGISGAAGKVGGVGSGNGNGA